MKLIIDRFESKFAICEKEDKNMIAIEKTKLPPNAKEGDVIVFDGDKYLIDSNETKNRKEKIERLMDNLFE